MNLFQALNGNTLPAGFFWQNPPEEWSLQNGRLHITALPGSNLFHSPDGTGGWESFNFLYTEVTGDFTFTAQVDAEMVFPYDACCLVIYESSRKYAKLCYEYWNGKPSVASVVTNGVSDGCPGCTLGMAKPCLRIDRTGNAFQFSYSLDNENWEPVRFFRLEMPGTLRVGVAAQSPAGTGCNAEVDFFELEIKN